MISPGSAIAVIAKRKLGAFLLIMATANPVTASYVPWIVEEGFSENIQVKLIIGGLLSIGYYAYLRAAFVSIGLRGMLFALGMCGLIFWKLQEEDVIDITDPDTMAWCSIASATVIFGFGMAWSIFRVRASGQVDPNV